MNAELKTKWIDALKSGNYTQGRYHLCVLDKTGQPIRWCCLGVLMDVAGAPFVDNTSVEMRYYNGGSEELSKQCIMESGLLDHQVSELMGLNDGRAPVLAALPHQGRVSSPVHSFAEIADWIEANIEVTS